MRLVEVAVSEGVGGALMGLIWLWKNAEKPKNLTFKTEGGADGSLHWGRASKACFVHVKLL